jgi:hypothetical protein
MKIYHKHEPLKGYIPSDKVHHNRIPFEIMSISHFGIEPKETRSISIEEAKARIVLSDFYKKLIEDGYHKALYLNKNLDGIDCFISR